MHEAAVINLQPFRNRANEMLVCPAMSVHASSPTTRREAAIALVVLGTLPQPAGTLALRNESHEARWSRLRALWSKGRTTPTPPGIWAHLANPLVGWWQYLLRIAVPSPTLIVLEAIASCDKGIVTIGNGTLALHRKVAPFGVMREAVTSGAPALVYHEGA
jgi:hypothetical protein